MTTGTGGFLPRHQGAARRLFGRLVWTGLRVVVSVATLVTLYYIGPLDHSSMSTAVAILLTGLAGFVALIAFQVRSIVRSRYPALRAVEALAVSIPFFLLLFAAAYVAMAAQSPGSFGKRLSHTSGVYFAVTVFTTVGFGDITAKSGVAQVAVTVQMLMDLIVFGLVIRVIVDAAHRGRERMQTMAADPPPGGEAR
ncbi:potassium channel family protein [Streptomyces sp. A1136]|uniref:potassium channel family protein n=1 Tax=Streptomyces sp. A1136 TaxID=2563102 RepID=UPI00109E3BC7|nr:potassium channel family protein [Streptomyces sp. A1136]THA46485.1 two pore domain potassium channel family protein [Streptomyces sp. A1136]